MRKMALKEIKGYVSNGAAVNLTDLSFEEMDDFLFARPRLEKIGISFGVHGINGVLLRDPVNGELFAVTKRTTALYMAL